MDFTDDMPAKATKAARHNGFTNVELRKGDIEDRILVEDNSVDVAVRMDWQEWSFLTQLQVKRSVVTQLAPKIDVVVLTEP